MGKLRIMEMIDKPSLGGGQTALLLLAENLEPSRFEVLIATGAAGPLVEEAERKGLRLIQVCLRKGLSLRSLREVVAALRTNKIDILHTHGGIAGLYGRLSAAIARTPVVVHTLHGIHYLHYRNPLLRLVYVFLERSVARFTDALILVCRSDFEQAKKRRLAPPEKMAVILNGIEARSGLAEEGAAAKRGELGFEPSRTVIGSIARLHRQKGIIHLLRAAERVLRERPEVLFVVVGEGPLGRRLRKEARALGLAEKFLFPGERKDAAAILALFDLFVLPSLWEGLPFVLVEAASLGKPIIASAVDGVPEIMTQAETGILVPPADPSSLAAAILRLLKDRELAGRLGERARALIPPRFPLRRMIEQTEALYLDLYKKKTSSIINAKWKSREPPSSMTG
jgi:glycosyltransferase involved in cell wall biosynthesis